MNMDKILSGIIVATVSIIFVGSVLAPQVSEYIGTTSAPGTLAEYSGLLGAVVVIMIVAILMIAVRLITSGRD